MQQQLQLPSQLEAPQVLPLEKSPTERSSSQDLKARRPSRKRPTTSQVNETSLANQQGIEIEERSTKEEEDSRISNKIDDDDHNINDDQNEDDLLDQLLLSPTTLVATDVIHSFALSLRGLMTPTGLLIKCWKTTQIYSNS